MAGEWFEDAFGPDGIRVTVCLEPAVERLVRESQAWGFLQPKLLDPIGNALRRALPGLVQERLLDGRWAVLVEADSGERVRLVRDSHDEAYATGESVRRSVERSGVAALEELR